MEPSWKNKKYQTRCIHPKSYYLEEFEKKDRGFPTRQNIAALPSYAALKAIFKDLQTLSPNNLEGKKTAFIDRIRAKTEKRRKQHWQYQDFDEILIRQIENIEDATQLKEWVGYFLEYYRLLKSENKND